jgi:hypothetical protein
LFVRLCGRKGGKNESQSIRKTDMRKVQDHQAKRQSDGHLRKPEAQAASGLDYYDIEGARARLVLPSG